MTPTQIDLTGFYRDHDGEEKFEWSGITFGCILGVLGGIGLMIYALTTEQGFGAVFFTGLSLMLVGCIFGCSYADTATRFCSRCGRPTEQHLADLDATNASGWLVSVIKRIEVNGRSYMRDSEVSCSQYDFSRGWTRLMCVVAACEDCRLYTVVTQHRQLPLTEEDRIALLEHATVMH